MVWGCGPEEPQVDECLKLFLFAGWGFSYKLLDFSSWIDGYSFCCSLPYPMSFECWSPSCYNCTRPPDGQSPNEGGLICTTSGFWQTVDYWCSCWYTGSKANGKDAGFWWSNICKFYFLDFRFLDFFLVSCTAIQSDGKSMIYLQALSFQTQLGELFL